MFPRFTFSNDRCPKCQRWYSLERARRPAWIKTAFFFIQTKGYTCTACQRTIIKIGNPSKRAIPADSVPPINSNV